MQNELIAGALSCRERFKVCANGLSFYLAGVLFVCGWPWLKVSAVPGQDSSPANWSVVKPQNRWGDNGAAHGFVSNPCLFWNIE